MEIEDYMVIITEGDVKLNKWHIKWKSYAENQLKQNKPKKIMTRQRD